MSAASQGRAGGRRREAGGIVGGGLLAFAAAAGLGLITAALTLGPPTPPRPEAYSGAVGHVGLPGLSRAEPVRIAIPAIGVEASVIPVGATARGELEVPDIERQAMQAGWYRLGPTPGEEGSSVIVGHVDSERTGPAIFFNLGKLLPGNVITVSRKDGSLAGFRVDSVGLYLKRDFPHDLVYGNDNAAQLRLITCGGDLDRQSKNYLSNVVVFATLAA